MKTIEKFLSDLCSLDIKLWVENDSLRCSAPKEALTPDIKTELAARKAEILTFISQANQALKSNLESIQPASRQGNLPLSFAQQRLWFYSQLEPHSSAYNIPAAVRLTGKLNIAAMSKSINEIIRRHEILRTTFTVVDGEAIQIIGKGENFTFPFIDLQTVAEEKKQQEVSKLAALEAQKPFDLLQGPLLRASLLRLAQTDHVVLLTMHHIVCDGWSTGIFIQELTALYTAFCQDKSYLLPKRPIQYADFAIWQRKWLQGEVLQTQLDYWKQQLSGNLPILELPTDQPRPAIQSNNGATQPFQLSKSLSEKLKDLSKQEGVTLFMTLLAAFKVLLYRYTQQEDIIVGTPIANRNRAEIEWLIGFFVNTLVLRTNLGNNPTFKEILQQVREVTLGAYAHQDLPFEKLLEELQIKRDLTHNPLFQVMFVLQNSPTEVIELPELNLEILKAHKNTANFDLTLSITETTTGLKGYLEYNTDIFNADRINRIIGHFQVLLEGIVTNPQQRLSELPLLTANEQHQLLVEWNNTEIDYPQDQYIHQLFEAQVEKTPDAIAVVFENQQLTYRELNAKANQLAHYLQKLGVQPEVLVGICVERSLEMFIGILGILKAGGVYLPLDPAYPKERLAFLLEDANIPLLLTQKKLKELLPNNQSEIIYLDADSQVIYQESQENIYTKVNSNNLAYIIYTSGSTGKPKGVMVEHQSLVNYTVAACYNYQIKSCDRILQFASICFDAAAEEIFPCLVQGATLLLRTDKMLSSIPAFLEQCNEFKITVLDLPTALWHQITTELAEKNLQLPEKLRLVIIGGERASLQHLEIWRNKIGETVQLINSYGPTETTIVATISNLSYLKEVRYEVPIGKPIANTQIYILDSHLQTVPVGVSGEIYIGGVGVTRGYLNRPELTAEKFIPNLFSNQPGSRLYKTGDLARYLPDGNIEFLGRIDHQVKIRGFRIELGEIEAVLNQHPDVQTNIVVVREDEPNFKRLVAYIVLNADKKITTTDLQSYLKEKVAGYMIPSAFVILDKLPLTPNGKVNRQALPQPSSLRPELAVSYVKPQTEIEKAIATIWQQALNLTEIGLHDNFFEIGGHSLLLIQVHSQLQKIYDHKLTVMDMFRYPTINDLAQFLTSNHAQNQIFNDEQKSIDNNQIRKNKQKERRQKMQKTRNI
ncbi:amino acid adenylation domain-containing protein (plasmid) [Nostoc sp. NIES-3756]|uniref:non-ribosomal peptide synthetase n=1 Tax=Nostoc sp. NIES-3756 TaxID=1751286 RepID=UPI00071FF778|nr:non-ribosomal peptide synthetase [Nostoc sp. NIES-3756]BAT56842.1 amino acid adenylation domain-containing protein [Nostoc sp. NIES-3756]